MGQPMFVLYLYIESEKNPDTDPTILWTNGGPGASSMFGIFVELGPLMANEDSLKTKGFNETGVPPRPEMRTVPKGAPYAADELCRIPLHPSAVRK